MAPNFLDMNYHDIVDFAKKYFLMEESDVRQALTNKITSTGDRYRLVAILGALKPSFELFVNETEDDLKRKIGRVIFSKLNYKNFDSNETSIGTRKRLFSLFDATTKKGINPYEIVYVTVLTQGELFLNDDGTYDQFKASYSSFNVVFSAIKDKFRIDNREIENRKIASMYERCSSLIYKVNTMKVEDNYKTLSNLCLVRKLPNDSDKKYEYIYLFNQSEVVEIFRNNPSLFTLTSGRIFSAFKYIAEKAKNYIENEYKKGNKLRKIDVLHDWIMNNSSVLTIKVEEMKRKENALRNELLNFYDENEVNGVISSLFNNPTNIAYVNKITEDNFFGKASGGRRNYQNVIRTIIKHIGKDEALNYFKNTKTIYGVEYNKLDELLANLKLMDSTQGNNLVQKFISSGDALVPFLETSKITDIIEKLKANKILEPIKLYNMTKREIAQEFYNVFAGEDAENGFNELERLLNINYKNECLVESLQDIYKNIDELIDLFGLKDKDIYDRHNHSNMPMIKNDVALQEKITNLGNIILGKLQIYAGKVRDTYNKYEPEEVGLAMQDYEDSVKKLKAEADSFVKTNIDSARKHYRNPDELADTFRANTASKLNISNTPSHQVRAFTKKLGTELLKPMSNELLKGKAYQPSLFDYGLAEENEANVYDIVLPEDDDAKFTEFLKRIKKQYKEIVKVVKSIDDKSDEIIIRWQKKGEIFLPFCFLGNIYLQIF